LKDLDVKIAAKDKAECFNEAFNIIYDVVSVSHLGEGIDKEEMVAIMIYIVLRACPRRLDSNMK